MSTASRLGEALSKHLGRAKDVYLEQMEKNPTAVSALTGAGLGAGGLGLYSLLTGSETPGSNAMAGGALGGLLGLGGRGLYSILNPTLAPAPASTQTSAPVSTATLDAGLPEPANQLSERALRDRTVRQSRGEAVPPTTVKIKRPRVVPGKITPTLTGAIQARKELSNADPGKHLVDIIAATNARMKPTFSTAKVDVAGVPALPPKPFSFDKSDIAAIAGAGAAANIASNIIKPTIGRIKKDIKGGLVRGGSELYDNILDAEGDIGAANRGKGLIRKTLASRDSAVHKALKNRLSNPFDNHNQEIKMLLDEIDKYPRSVDVKSNLSKIKALEEARDAARARASTATKAYTDARHLNFKPKRLFWSGLKGGLAGAAADLTAQWLWDKIKASK